MNKIINRFTGKVITFENGILAVDYDKIDVDFRRADND